MIRILALILRNQWVPEGSNRKDHGRRGGRSCTMGKGSRYTKVLRQFALPMWVHLRDYHQAKRSGPTS